MVYGFLGFALGIITTLYLPKKVKVIVYVSAFLIVLIIAVLDSYYGLFHC